MGQTITVAAGQSCTVTVTFTPQVAGGRSTQLTIEGNFAPGPRSLTLSGDGASPPNVTAQWISPSVDPSGFMTFGNVPPGTVSEYRTLIIENTGGSTANNVSFDWYLFFGEYGTSELYVTSGCGIEFGPVSLPPGTECGVDIQILSGPGSSGRAGGGVYINGNQFFFEWNAN